jgi:hypothetical protein
LIAVEPCDAQTKSVAFAIAELRSMGQQKKHHIKDQSLKEKNVPGCREH